MTTMSVQVRTEYNFSLRIMDTLSYAMWQYVINNDILKILTHLQPDEMEIAIKYNTECRAPLIQSDVAARDYYDLVDKFFTKECEDATCNEAFAANINALSGFLDHRTDPEDMIVIFM